MKYAKQYKLGNENLAIHSFESEKDLKLCLNAIERVLSVMADMSFVDICKTLEPYRIKNAKAYDKEVANENTEAETDYKEIVNGIERYMANSVAKWEEQGAKEEYVADKNTYKVGSYTAFSCCLQYLKNLCKPKVK